MEIQGSDGTKFQLKPNSTTIFGRGNGFPTNDLSVSRRHTSLDFNNTQTNPTISFEVLGKNPIWVFNKQEKNAKIKAFKRFERGELGIHDLFCVSPKNPVWFSLKMVVDDEVIERESSSEEIDGRFNDELSQSLENASEFKGSDDFDLGFVDVSSIDPVKEFGFLVIGHEFDQYPKHMIRDIKNWDWFLDDPRGDSDEEDSKKKRTTSGRRKRKKTSRGDDDVDEEWTGESEGEELTTNARKVQKPKYQTRSKDHGARQKNGKNKKSSASTSRREEEEESEDEEDETLGGFIVNDNTTEEEEEENEVDEDEEEEFVDDEDELED